MHTGSYVSVLLDFNFSSICSTYFNFGEAVNYLWKNVFIVLSKGLFLQRNAEICNKISLLLLDHMEFLAYMCLPVFWVKTLLSSILNKGTWWRLVLMSHRSFLLWKLKSDNTVTMKKIRIHFRIQFLSPHSLISTNSQRVDSFILTLSLY